MNAEVTTCTLSEAEHWIGGYRNAEYYPVIKLTRYDNAGNEISIEVFKEDIDILEVFINRLRNRETRHDGY
jgi:hypothetical protein